MTNAIALTGYTPAQIQTIKATVAKDTNNTEFDLFMEACRSYGLDPFRKQIHAVVYGKNDDKKRKMSIIVSRDGLRVLAQRCGDYRPASEPATLTYDTELVSPTNPKGIVMASVRLWKQDNRGDWYPVIGEALWDEFAPLKDEWVDGDDGRRRPSGKLTLDASGNWAKMPVVMITKCAESQALRAGWPDTFGNIHGEEEMDRLRAEETATEVLRRHEQEERQARIGGPGLMLVFDDSMKLEKVPMGSAADRIMEHIQRVEPVEVHKFRIRNEQSLRELWANDAAAALEIKKEMEKREAQIASQQGKAA